MSERFKERSPFTPGHIVAASHFFGRTGEIQLLQRGLVQTSKGKLQTYFITGEWGMGKSSLAALMKDLAEKRYGLMGAQAFVGGATSNEEVVRRLFESLVRESNDSPMRGRVRDIFGSLVKEVGILGITLSFSPRAEDLEHLTSNLITALRDLHKRLGPDVKGFVLILDDINGIAEDPKFANYLKSLIDGAATCGKDVPLMLILVGLPEIRDKLLEGQPSIGRIFEVIEVSQLDVEDTSNFFRTMFSSVEMEIDEVALSMLSDLSGGYPMLIHEIGDSTFWADVDLHIDVQDAMNGIAEATRRVGEKYLERQVYSAIRSQNYHSIIQKMVQGNVGACFEKAKVETILSKDEGKVFHNFLQKMKRLGVIRSGENKGEYYFSNQLFYLYIRMSANKGERVER